MRKLTDHIVPGTSDNLTVATVDAPGAGGANHHYLIAGFATPTIEVEQRHAQMQSIAEALEDLPSGPTETFELLFQNGPIGEVGVNGITEDSLMTILIDRLRSFQKGPYASSRNQITLSFLEQALHSNQTRTRDRIARQVEGTSEQ